MEKIYCQIEDKEIINNLKLHVLVGAINALFLCGVIIAFGVWIWPGFPVLLLSSLVISLPLSNLFILLHYERFKNVTPVFLRFCIWDTLILTTILHYCGDLKSPLVFIYLVPIAMAGEIFSLKRITILISIYVGSYLGLIIFEGLGIIPSIHFPGVNMSIGCSWAISAVAIILLAAVGIIITKAIDQRREKEYELTRAKDEKLAAAAQIASEVAHEIRNPLSVTKAVVYVLRGALPKEENVQNRLDQIDKATEKILTYINDLLNFSRPPVLNLRPTNLNEVLKMSLEELPREIFADIEIETDLASDLPRIEADPLRLKEVFSNIIKNGCEAMGKSGRLNIRTKKKDEFVEAEIEDKGPGIDKENLPQIFDPFFTTKAKGTGLGLAICHRIIEAHKGEIDVRSTVGEGTTFTVKLPLTA